MQRPIIRFRFTLFQRQFLSHLLVALLLLALLGTAFTYFARHQIIEKNKGKELLDTTRAVARILQREDVPSGVLANYRSFLKDRNITIVLMSRSGELLEKDAGLMGASGRSKQVLDSLRQQLWNAQSDHTFVIEKETADPLMVASRSVKPKGKKEEAVLFAISPMRGLNETIANMEQVTLMSMGIAFVFILAVVIWLSRGTSRAVLQIRRAAGRIASGQYDTRIGTKRTDELGDLAREFNTMADQLQLTSDKLLLAETRRRQFLSDVSHELRTPLTSIRGLVEALKSGIVTAEESSKAYTIIEKETIRLIRLINELLDIEKMQTGQITLHKASYSAKDILEIVAETMEVLAAQKRLRLQIDCPQTLIWHGDYDRLIQIAMNIVKNAIQFSDFGTIRLAGSEYGGNTVIEISDQGSGMTPDERERIFDRFYKADPSRSREKGENGLGLFIVKQLTEAHGGTVEAFSEPGIGTTFRLFFPTPQQTNDDAGAETGRLPPGPVPDSDAGA
ncbi:sensor histidine kinase [Paenibacillus ginsengarvi]|uniref:histidine kinase n=1 Tax=Paenibacillus ginsengarvi TaxID=400777 RepID=A0A3B0AZJ4_9BACL|nr:HAMP domain-containing sensor histidine kinase [Paenibacillus ginsengarvi]RKN65466.1 sensor histidine kinase [Paenibacillus ginsengarvi]